MLIAVFEFVAKKLRIYLSGSENSESSKDLELKRNTIGALF